MSTAGQGLHLNLSRPPANYYGQNPANCPCPSCRATVQALEEERLRQEKRERRKPR